MQRKNARYAGTSFDLRRKILSNKMGTPINVIKQYLVQFHEGRSNSRSMHLFLKYSYLYLFTNSP